MSTLVGKKAPDFQARTASSEQFDDIELSQYHGQHVLLFFYPLDFTFVCPTELLAFQDKLSEFEKLNTVLLGCSIIAISFIGLGSIHLLSKEGFKE